jgi:ornithine cyclodeaminase/alanine dehydrogenase
VPPHGVASAEEAVRERDVVITCGPMTRDSSRAIDPGWLRADVLVLPVDYSAAVGADVVAAAHDLVSDDPAQLEASRDAGWFEGWRTPDASLGERVRSGRTGRRTVSCSLGVGVADAATAGLVLRRAEERGSGVLLPR